MQWHRGLVFASLALVACSSTNNYITNVPPEDGGADDGSTGTPRDGGGEGSVTGEAGPDGGEPDGDAAAAACTGPAPTGTASSDCTVEAACSSASCASGFVYKCAQGAGARGGYPADVTGCVASAADSTSGPVNCCPAACVRNAAFDADCNVGSARKGVMCAPSAVPPTGCIAHPSAGTNAFCCP